MAKTDKTQDHPAHAATLVRQLNKLRPDSSGGVIRRVEGTSSRWSDTPNTAVHLYASGPQTDQLRMAEFTELTKIIEELGYRVTLVTEDVPVPRLHVIKPGVPLTPRQRANQEQRRAQWQAEWDAGAADRTAEYNRSYAEESARLRLLHFARLHPAAQAAVTSQEQNRDDTAAEITRGDAHTPVTNVMMWNQLDGFLNMYTDGDEHLTGLLAAAHAALSACNKSDLYTVSVLDAIRAPFTAPVPPAVTHAMTQAPTAPAAPTQDIHALDVLITAVLRVPADTPADAIREAMDLQAVDVNLFPGVGTITELSINHTPTCFETEHPDSTTTFHNAPAPVVDPVSCAAILALLHQNATEDERATLTACAIRAGLIPAPPTN